MKRRTLIFLLAGLMVLALSGIAAAARSGHGATPTRGKSVEKTTSGNENEPAENEQEAEGVHGGSVARVHDGCSLPDGVSLRGNWTHGDYVSAWVKSDPTTAQDAAHSSCGKPAAAVGHSNEKGKSSEHSPHGPPSGVPAAQPVIPTHR